MSALKKSLTTSFQTILVAFLLASPGYSVPNPVPDAEPKAVADATAEAGPDATADPEYYGGGEHCSTVYEDVCTPVTEQNCQTKYKVQYFRS